MGKLKKAVNRAMHGESASGIGGSLAGELGLQPFLKPEAKPPELPEMPVMPEADSDEVRKARRRSMMKQIGRSGRESTILTDTLG